MSRPLRIAFPGAFYHITARGNEQKDIFRNQSDREKFMTYLQSHPEAGFVVMRTIARQVANALSDTDQLLKQMLWNTPL